MKEVTVRELRNHGGQVLDRVANDLPVFTCNPTDFAGIDDLKVVAVDLPTVRE